MERSVPPGQNARRGLDIIAPIALFERLNLGSNFETPFGISVKRGEPDHRIGARAEQHAETPLKRHRKNRKAVIVGMIADEIYPARRFG